jgi:hypothetical protein
MTDAEDIVEVVPEEDHLFTMEEERRLRALDGAHLYLDPSRHAPPTIYEIFEFLHYLDHWIATGEVPSAPDTTPKLNVILGGKDAKPAK